MHIDGLERMGAKVSSEHGFVIAEADRLHGASIWLDFPSVGATENLVSAAALADGTTVIDNAAREPEIVDICGMLIAMGAKISGAGESTVLIEGVPELKPVRHRTVGDRMVAGTWAVAATMTRGDVLVRGADPRNLEIALDKICTAGAQVSAEQDGFRVKMDHRPKAVDVVTLPYPGFPTDLMPMAIALAAVSDGPSMVTENVFDARFMFVNEMARLGADVRTDGHHAVVRGRDQLSPGPVTGDRARHPGRCGPAAGRPVCRRRHRGVRHPPHRPGLPGFRPAAAGVGRGRAAGRRAGRRTRAGILKERPMSFAAPAGL